MQPQATGGAPQRPVLRPGGGRGRAALPPDPTLQQDRHTVLGGLLLRAERAPDPLERILAVTRVVLCLATDLLRPGKGFGDTPTVVLGHHYLSRRQLAERHRGDPMQLFLQELCSHEPLGPTLHVKYAAPATSSGGAPGAGAAPVAATLALRLRPVVTAHQQQAGLLAQLAGGAGGGKAAGGADGGPAAWLECALEGSVRISLPRHAEAYVCTLPALVLAAPLAEACPLDLSGTAAISCEATGLSATLRFRPFKAGQLRGSVATLLGEGQHEVASLSGSWQGTVTAESAEGSGALFDASHFRPRVSPAINLAEPGPRATTRLWAALLEAIIYTDAAAAAKEGKRAAELAAALPAHLRRSLLYEVETSGLKPKRQAAAAEEEAAQAQAQAQPADAGSDPGAGVLPPCVLAHRSTHGGLSYQLHYRLQAA